MADERSIVITLKLDNGEENSTNNQTDLNKKNQQNDNSSKVKAAATALVIQAASVAMNETIAWAEYYWNRELTLSDDYVGQRNKQIALTQINRGINLISTIGSATASGAAVGGWAGAIIGAAIGTTSAIAGISRSNAQGRDQQDIMLRQMDAQLDFTRSRAGWSTKAASIGEDL